MVDADKRSKTPLFNNDQMAAWLTEITKDPYDGQHLPKFDFEFVKNETAIRFRVTATELVTVEEDLKADAKEKDSTHRASCNSPKTPQKDNKV